MDTYIKYQSTTNFVAAGGSRMSHHSQQPSRQTTGHDREQKAALDQTLYMNSFESDKNTKDPLQGSSAAGTNNPSFIKTILEPKTLLNELMSPSQWENRRNTRGYEKVDRNWQQLTAKNFNPDKRAFKHRQIIVSQTQSQQGKMLFELKNMSQDFSVAKTPLSLKHRSGKPLETGGDRPFWHVPPATSQQKTSPRYPQISFSNPKQLKNGLAKSSSSQHCQQKDDPLQVQREFDKFQMIEPIDVLRTSLNDKLQDQNLRFQGMVHNPAIKTQNLRGYGSKPQSQMSSRSALTQVKNYQHQRMRRMQKKANYSIKKIDSDAQEANMSAEIQQLISRRRGMSINLQNNLFKSAAQTTPSVNTSTTYDKRSMQQVSNPNSVRNDFKITSRNDYRAFMRSHGDSLSKLNTNGQHVQKHGAFNFENVMSVRNSNIDGLSSISDMNRVSRMRSRPSQDNIQVVDQQNKVHDSIMVHEVNLGRIKDAQDNQLHASDPMISLKSEDQQISCQMILDQLLDAQSQAPYYNQPKIDRLMIIDQMINNSNYQFKSSILSKFQQDYVKKQIGLEKQVNSEVGWLMRDIRRGQGRKLHQILRNAQHKLRMESIEKSSNQILSASTRESPRKETSLELTLRDTVQDQNLLDTVQEEEDNMATEVKLNVKDDEAKRPETEEVKKRTISLELKRQTEQTCQDLDRIIEDRKKRQKSNFRAMRVIIDGGPCSKEDDANLDNPLTSTLEKKRRRVVNQFEQKIKLKKQMLEDVKRYIEMKVAPDEKAQRILSYLHGKDRDPEVNMAYEKIQPQTALFLADLVGDIMSESQKFKMLQDLSRQLHALVDSRDQYDRSMRNKIMMKLSKDGVMRVVNKGVKDLARQGIQQVLNNQELEMQKQYIISLKQMQQRKLEQQKNKTVVKKPQKFQKMVQKNFHSIVNTRIDMGYMTKILNMLQQLEAILGEQTIGFFYNKIPKNNIWENDYFRDNDIAIEFGNNLKKLHDFNDLYKTDVQTRNFYNDIKVKRPHLIDKSETEKLASMHFQDKLERGFQRSLPTFAKMNKNELFLNEIVITDEMAQGLSDYLKDLKQYPEKITKALFIENCSMRDEQLAKILQGINAQGYHLRTFVYSSGELNVLAANELSHQISNLRNLHLINITRNQSKPVIRDLLNKISDYGYVIQKLKLSRMNICDNELVQCVSKVIQERTSLIHLDLSWAKLLPKQMNVIIQSLLNAPRLSLKDLNLSYNSLIQPPLDESINFNQESSDFLASKEFVKNLCEYMVNNTILNHLDVSGMNLSKQQILQVAETAITQSECLLAIHLSDNGIRFDQEVRDEILDMMGLSSDIFRILTDEEFTTNQRVCKPENVKGLIKQYNMSLNSSDYENFALSDANIYTNRMLQTKMGKSVVNQMNQHKVSTIGGVGRLQNSLVDQFILSRRVNNPELVFNQHPYMDRYYEMDSAERWRLQDTSCGISGGCPICNKHKYTMIFYEQDLEDPWSENEGLIEIKDQKQIEKLIEDLNISFRYAHEVAPIVIGSVVTGGFKRKLRMIRADYFFMLSVSQSIYTVSSSMQIKAIKRGLLANLFKCQALQEEDPHLRYLMGWQKQIVIDKCIKNEVEDVCLINFPPILRPKPKLPPPPKADLDQSQVSIESPQPKVEEQKAEDKDCTMFVYAAYLPPGPHQFLIYCPKTKRVFVKDIVVDLNECEPFPEYPETYQPAKKVRRPTRQNVWRQWRNDTKENIKMAYLNDMHRPEGPSFIKDEADLKKCNKILTKNFSMLQIVFMEIITQSPHFYPKIPFENLIQQIVDMQTTDEEKKALQRSQVELAFMGATKYDGVKGVSGSLNRGQFFEIIMRLTQQRFPREKLSTKLEDFIAQYFKATYDSSKILSIRKTMRDSKKLNQLLFDNKVGLKEFFLDYKEYPGGFTYLSATRLLNPLDEDTMDGIQLIPEMQRHFYIAKMTILKDKEEKMKYNYLVYVEFLDFLCRVGIELWLKDGQPEDAEVHVKVYYLLQKLWRWREHNAELVPDRPLKKGEEKLEEWPELVPVMDIDGDSDE